MSDQKRFDTPEELVERIDAVDDPQARQAIRSVWETLAGYANDNAGRLDVATRIIRRFAQLIVGGILVIVAIMIATGIATVKLTIDQGHEQQRAASSRRAAVQVSRFDSTFFSCLAADNGNRLARRDIVSVLRHPTHGSIYRLVDDVRSFRATGSPPPPALPKHVPKAWVTGCRQYSAMQVTLTPPANAPAPPPRNVTTTASSSKP